MRRPMWKHIDNFGMVVNRNKEAGDSIHFTSMVYCGSKWQGINPGLDVDKIIHGVYKDGLLRRHPDATRWTGDWDRGSRDQWIAFLIMCAVAGRKDILEDAEHHFRKRNWFCNNTRHNWTYALDDPRNPSPDKLHRDGDGKVVPWEKKMPDFAGPMLRSIIKRGLNRTDRTMFWAADMGHWLYTKKMQAGGGDPSTHTIIGCYIEREHSTWPGRCSMKAYKKIAQPRLDRHYSEERNHPPINEIYKPLMEG